MIVPDALSGKMLSQELKQSQHVDTSPLFSSHRKHEQTESRDAEIAHRNAPPPFPLVHPHGFTRLFWFEWAHLP